MFDTQIFKLNAVIML